MWCLHLRGRDKVDWQWPGWWFFRGAQAPEVRRSCGTSSRLQAITHPELPTERIAW